GLGLVLVLFPLLDPNKSHVNVAADAGTFILLALGLNIVVGFAGLLDLGYAAFFAIGSYAYAMLASGQFNIHIPFWFLLLTSAFTAAFFGLLLALLLLSVVLISNLRGSRLGRAWMAIREDEVAAASNGINTVTTKLLAFAMGAAFSGFAGTYAASKLFIVSPDDFGFVVSVSILVMIVLGGMGNLRGVIVGAVLIFFIQRYLLIQLPGWIAALTANIPFLASVDVAGYVQRSNYLIFGL